MKLSLILEAKLNRPWLEKQLGKDNPSVDKIVASDPTNGSYYAWLCKLVQSIGSDDFLTPQLYNDLDEWDRNKQTLKNLNINADLTGKDLEYFNANLEKLREHKALKASSKRGSGVTYMSKEYPGAEVILDDGTYKLFKIEGTSPEAIDSLERLGIGTEWCTRKGGIASQAERYLSDATQHVLYKNSKPLYQFGGKDFKDVHDLHAAPTKEEVKMLWKVVKDATPIVYHLYHKALKEKRRCPELESYIIKEPEVAYRYAYYVMKGERWPDAEQYIMQDPEAAVLYTMHVIKGPWPELEPIIMRDPARAYWYAYYILKRRWPEAEPYISKSPKWSRAYAARFKDYVKERQNTARSTGRVGIPGQKSWALYSESIYRIQ